MGGQSYGEERASQSYSAGEPTKFPATKGSRSGFDQSTIPTAGEHAEYPTTRGSSSGSRFDRSTIGTAEGQSYIPEAGNNQGFEPHHMGPARPIGTTAMETREPPS